MRRIRVGSTRMRINTKKGTTFFGHTGTVQRVVNGRRITLELEQLRGPNVHETFDIDDLQVVKALRNHREDDPNGPT